MLSQSSVGIANLHAVVGYKSLGIAAHGPQTAFCASGRDASSVTISTVEQGALNRVQHHVEILAHVFSKEA